MVQAGGGNSSLGRHGDARGGQGSTTFISTPSNSDTNFFALEPKDILEAAVKGVCEELLDDAILNVAFEVHRSMKRGLLGLETGSDEDAVDFHQVNVEGLDVFGQAPVKKQHECICPNCSRNLAASRFAPHLEKCMGMGRNSSRIASRRIQNSTRDTLASNANSATLPASDDDDDDDWIVDRKRRKRDKNSPKRSRNVKVKGENGTLPKDQNSNGSNGSSTSSNGISFTNGNFSNIDSFQVTNVDDKKVLTGQLCGVISEHTRKMCTRSLRCPQHTDLQKKAVRDLIITNEGSGVNGSGPLGATTRASADSTSQAFPSSYDCDSAPLASSWDHDLSNNTSPADSTSTNNSSSTNHSKESHSSKQVSKASKRKSKSSSSSSKRRSVDRD